MFKYKISMNLFIFAFADEFKNAVSTCCIDVKLVHLFKA